jgi:hypothetical protein
MKTLKLIIIALFVTVTAINFSNADGFKAKPTAKIINLTIQQAVQDPALVLAMHQQLNPDFLSNNQPVYVGVVKYNNYTVRISGTYDQWRIFFRIDLENIGVIRIVEMKAR